MLRTSPPFRRVPTQARTLVVGLITALLAVGGGGVAAAADDGDGPAPPMGSRSGTVRDGGTLDTDPDDQGPSPGQPLTAAVTSANAGRIELTTDDAGEDDGQHGLAAFARTLEITAPLVSRAQPLQVTLRLDSSALDGMSPTRPVVLFDGQPVTAVCDADGRAIPDPCLRERTTADDGDLEVELLATAGGTVTFTEPSLACPGILTRSDRYEDVSGAHAGAIDCIASWRPGTGFPDGSYEDARAVTRGQLTSLLAASLAAGGTELPRDAAAPFGDVDGSVHVEAIAQLAELGIVTGTSEGSFEPDVPVTRAQAASIVVRTTEQFEQAQLAASDTSFTDVDSEAHATAIAKAASNGLVSGYSEQRFAGDDHVDRGHAATFVVRMLDRLVDGRRLQLPL